MKQIRGVRDAVVIAFVVLGGTPMTLAQHEISKDGKVIAIASQPSASDIGNSDAPYLQLVGGSSGASEAATPGDEVTVFGTRFCGRPDCSDVSISIGNHLVLQGIRPNADGSFRGRFRVTESPGYYLVRASQQAGQTKLEDVKPLIVPAED